ncbi:MAG TPA: TadE/TadG family type IV pilus assembly protein [Ilumatobacter sp.]|nr:TadE/TadG family type IV pilus assembly protein [Ilumatobacter sp.]
MIWRRRLRDDRGSVSVELVVIAPLFGLLLAAVIAVGRVHNAHADVDAAARMAARELSIARDPSARLAQAEQSAAITLDVGTKSCESMSFQAVITVERVEVTVACAVGLQEAALLPLPGTMMISATASELRDRYREQS